MKIIADTRAEKMRTKSKNSGILRFATIVRSTDYKRKEEEKMGEYMDVETYEEYFKENGCIARKVYHSYVILLTEKNGSEVKAVRLHTDKKKGNADFFEELKAEFPELDKWNVKGVWRLYEDDFRK